VSTTQSDRASLHEAGTDPDAGVDASRFSSLQRGIERTVDFARKHAEALALVAIFGLGLWVRAVHVLPAGFPLNDGGLFYAMAEDIQRAGYTLPEFSSYNDGTIPFVYSPLAFYFAALLDDLTPLSLLDGIWLLPLVESVFVVAAFHLFARSLLSDRWAAIVATAAFAVVPRSFIWLIMGGGLTRALGLAFALLALREARRIHAAEDWWRPALLGACYLALTVLAHLEAAAFLVASLPLFALLPPRRRGVLILGAIGLGGLLLTAPWWSLVLARHGIEPFLAARDFGGSLLAQGTLDTMWLQLRDPIFTGEPFFPLIGALGLLGAVYSIARGRVLLPAWWVLILLLNMRAFPTFAAVPTALLVGVAVRWVIAPSLTRAVPSTDSAPPRWGGRWQRPAQYAGIAAIVVGALWFAILGALEDRRGDQRYLEALSSTEVAAMRWVEQRTPEDARFVVISRNRWFADRDGEWFPVLAERESVNTVQGYEWVDGEFVRRSILQFRARNCRSENADCLEPINQRAPFDYVYVPPICCSALRASLLYDPRYEVVYNRGATIARRSEAEKYVRLDYTKHVSLREAGESAALERALPDTVRAAN